jgi:hypothetical protein
MTTCLVIHLCVTWFLVGLIWVIQVVHYPLMKQVGQANFITYHDRHMALITWVVGPLMLAELGSAVALSILGLHSSLFLSSLAGLILVWASTIFIQIPLHQRLTRGYDRVLIDRLVTTNSWRTGAWTLRGLCLGLLLHPFLP